MCISSKIQRLKLNDDCDNGIKSESQSRETAHWLRVLAVLAEDLDSGHITTIYNSTSGRSKASSENTAHTYMQANTDTHACKLTFTHIHAGKHSHREK